MLCLLAHEALLFFFFVLLNFTVRLILCLQIFNIIFSLDFVIQGFCPYQFPLINIYSVGIQVLINNHKMVMSKNLAPGMLKEIFLLAFSPLINTL